jgi:hypothetical protein
VDRQKNQPPRFFEVGIAPTQKGGTNWIEKIVIGIGPKGTNIPRRHSTYISNPMEALYQLLNKGISRSGRLNARKAAVDAFESGDPVAESDGLGLVLRPHRSS